MLINHGFTVSAEGNIRMNYSVLVMGNTARLSARPRSDEGKAEAEQRQAADEQIAAPLLDPGPIAAREVFRAPGRDGTEDQADNAQNENHRGLLMSNRPSGYPTVK